MKSKTTQVLLALSVMAFALGGIGYFTFKDRQIRTASTDHSISSTPTLTPNAPYTTIDPTSGWIKYHDTNSNYTIEYPKEWEVHTFEVSGYVEIFRPDLYSGGDNNPHGSLIIEEFYVIPSFEQKLLNKFEVVNGTELNCKEINIPSVKLDCWVKIPNQEKYLNIEQIKDQDSEINQTVDQILTTFKFLDSSTNPTISTPAPNSKVSSPLIVSGTVPAGWMFEGVFPIKLVDENNKLISQGQAKEVVPGSWQSGQPVDFEASIEFITNANSGYLVVENDNPSGLPENLKIYEVPVNF